MVRLDRGSSNLPGRTGVFTGATGPAPRDPEDMNSFTGTPQVDTGGSSETADWKQVASYASYPEAQRAVDRLSDASFPVENIEIVGRDLRIVERVTGRLTTGKATLAGAGTGAWWGDAQRAAEREARNGSAMSGVPSPVGLAGRARAANQSRPPRHTEERASEVQNRIADRITTFAGSMAFVYIHVIWFACWIGRAS